MKQEITQAIATSTATLTASSGILTVAFKFFDNNAAGIGAMSTIFFGLIYVYFQWSSNQKLTVAEINTINIDALSQDFHDHKIETTEKLESLSDGMKPLLSRKA